jgi:hypothetical protein
MMNILIYPQKIKVTAAANHQGNASDTQNREQQERVRDYIQYLKTAKQVLASSSSERESVLFALSDVIDEQNVNCEALIRHMMCMYEGIVGVNAAG